MSLCALLGYFFRDPEDEKKRNERYRLILKRNDILHKRFRVLDACGAGSFSNVYLCKDIKSDSVVIVKIYRRRECYDEPGQREAKIMEILNELDRDGSLFVKYLGSFRYKDHLCLVLERYGPSLGEAIYARDDRTLKIPVIKAIIFQIIQALRVLHRNGMTHTDIKIENILLPVDFDLEKGFDDIEIRTPVKSTLDVRLIDFGSLSSNLEWHQQLITTAEYRAPEIIMGLNWGYECDIWSLGCLLVELAIGSIPFGCVDDIEHLFTIQHMIGPLPQWMCDECSRRNVCETLSGNLVMPSALDLDQRKRAMNQPPLRELLDFDEDLTDAALRMLETDPFKRISLDQLLELPMFVGME